MGVVVGCTVPEQVKGAATLFFLFLLLMATFSLDGDISFPTVWFPAA
jgi:hypothetical protein